MLLTQGGSVVVFWISLLPLILDLLLLLVQIGDLQRAGEMDREERRGERVQAGDGEDHRVRSVAPRGEAKNNTLIIHIPSFEVGDSQLRTGRQGLCSLSSSVCRGRGK